jgi:hypothetical protein
MTTSDKKPRRTTKSAKAAKSAENGDAFEQPAPMKAKAGVQPAGGAAIASSLSTAAEPATSLSSKSGGRARSPGAAAKAVETRRIKDISVTVTSRHREDRHASIALAAYFRSESRGFAPGLEVEDWLAAEEEVDQRLLGEGRAS